MAKNVLLKDENGNIILPITSAESVKPAFTIQLPDNPVYDLHQYSPYTMSSALNFIWNSSIIQNYDELCSYIDSQIHSNNLPIYMVDTFDVKYEISAVGDSGLKLTVTVPYWESSAGYEILEADSNLSVIPQVITCALQRRTVEMSTFFEIIESTLVNTSLDASICVTPLGRSHCGNSSMLYTKALLEEISWSDIAFAGAFQYYDSDISDRLELEVPKDFAQINESRILGSDLVIENLWGDYIIFWNFIDLYDPEYEGNTFNLGVSLYAKTSATPYVDFQVSLSRPGGSGDYEAWELVEVVPLEYMANKASYYHIWYETSAEKYFIQDNGIGIEVPCNDFVYEVSRAAFDMSMNKVVVIYENNATDEHGVFLTNAEVEQDWDAAVPTVRFINSDKNLLMTFKDVTIPEGNGSTDSYNFQNNGDNNDPYITDSQGSEVSCLDYLQDLFTVANDFANKPTIILNVSNFMSGTYTLIDAGEIPISDHVVKAIVDFYQEDSQIFYRQSWHIELQDDKDPIVSFETFQDTSGSPLFDIDKITITDRGSGSAGDSNVMWYELPVYNYNVTHDSENNPVYSVDTSLKIASIFLPYNVNSGQCLYDNWNDLLENTRDVNSAFSIGSLSGTSDIRYNGSAVFVQNVSDASSMDVRVVNNFQPETLSNLYTFSITDIELLTDLIESGMGAPVIYSWMEE